MNSAISSASILVVDLVNEEQIALQTIHASESECSLSGLWVLDLNEKEKINAIAAGKRAIYLGTSKKIKLDVLKTVSLVNLAEEGLEMSSRANLAFLDFKRLDEAKRKNLVQPSFFSWNVNVDLNNPKSELNRLRKVEEIKGTAPEVENILTASRLIQLMLQGWIADEVERNSREYLRVTNQAVSVIPQSWI